MIDDECTVARDPDVFLSLTKPRASSAWRNPRCVAGGASGRREKNVVA